MYLNADNGNYSRLKAQASQTEDCLNGMQNLLGHDDGRETDLIRAVRFSGCIKKVVESLLMSEDANERGKYGKIAVHQAARDGNEEMMRVLIERGGSVVAVDNFGLTPLHEAKNETVLRIMLQEGKFDSLEIGDGDGQTPLHGVAVNGDVGMMKMLLEAGADIDAVTNDGETAIHLAALNGNLKAVKILADSGAILNMKNGDGETAGCLARMEGHEQICEFLAERMKKEMGDLREIV